MLKGVDAFKVPGYVVGVTGGNVGRFERAVGFADVQRKRKMTVDTRFRIGSISKTFTATVILRLVESGRLHLDDRLSTWEFTPALATEAPLRHEGPPGTAPIHPSFEERPGAPDAVFASLDDLDYERQVRAWARELQRAGAA